MSYFTKRILLACLFAAAPGSMFAVDGVTLIDQSHALAGNITPGDAPGFPITITQPGSYRLTGDLTIPDADTTGILITAEYVTLDLNGFSIVGPVVCKKNPVECPAVGKGNGIQAGNGFEAGPRGIRILNGSVRGMGSAGIFITGLGSFVHRVSADSNAAFGMIVAGTVLESSALENGRTGILAITVRESTAEDNGGVGIQLDASGGVAVGNIASFNLAAGIASPNGTVIGNTMVRNATFGLTAVCPSSMSGNTIVSNTQGSIQTNGTPGCVIVNNATRP